MGICLRQTREVSLVYKKIYGQLWNLISWFPRGSVRYFSSLLFFLAIEGCACKVKWGKKKYYAEVWWMFLSLSQSVGLLGLLAWKWISFWRRFKRDCGKKLILPKLPITDRLIWLDGWRRVCMQAAVGPWVRIRLAEPRVEQTFLAPPRNPAAVSKQKTAEDEITRI